MTNFVAMADKTVHSCLVSKISIILSIVCLLLCCAVFIRTELTFKEMYPREIKRSDEMTLKHDMNDGKRLAKEYRPKQESHHQKVNAKDRKLSRKIRNAVDNITANIITDVKLSKRIKEEVGKAIANLKSAKYWISIPGPPGPPGKVGPRGPRGLSGPRGPKGLTGKTGARGPKGRMGRKGPRGKRGPRGFLGKIGLHGPRGMPGPIGPKGDRGPSLARPTVIISPANLIVNESQSAILHCSSSGYPRPDVVWSKSNGTLPHKRTVVDNTGKLVIKHVTDSDSGIYQCKASNLLGSTRTTAKLQVNFAPRLTLNKGPIYKTIGDNVTLPTCHVTGEPKPTVTWSKSIGSLPKGRVVVENRQLTILNATKDDSGFYVCKAENLLGSSVAGVTVIIIQLPVFVGKPPKTDFSVTGNTIMLNCSAKGDPPPVITWRKENGALPAGRYEVKDGSLIINNVKKTDSGVFVCTATSAGVFDIETKTTLEVFLRKDCADLYKSGERRNGVYTVQPDNQGAFQVYCDMTTDGGGWTVFQRRQDGSVDFYLGWQQYKTGFGNLNGEFWLGSDYIHRLTSYKSSSLRVEIGNWDGVKKYAKYGSFSVGDESDKYRLRVGSYSGNAGDSLAYHNNMAFSTKDRDNSKYSGKCAVRFTGAWWYHNCGYSNLNGKYLGNVMSRKGINWFYAAYSNSQSFKFSEMKLRPK